MCFFEIQARLDAGIVSSPQMIRVGSVIFLRSARISKTGGRPI